MSQPFVSSRIHPFISPSNGPRPIPPLAQGDRLTRAQFLERYAAMPNGVKAERIEGIVYMLAAAVSAGFHGDPHAIIVGWLVNYQAATPGVTASDNSTLVLDPDNDPQPDACLRILPSHGGRANLDSGQFIQGAPELVVEVTASSASYDLGAKLNVYRRNGVQEYLVHRTYDGEIDWFALRDGQYGRIEPGVEGIYRSEIFPGLWLKADALVAGNVAEVLLALQRGIATAEHGEFVKKLEGQSKANPVRNSAP